MNYPEWFPIVSLIITAVIAGCATVSVWHTLKAFNKQRAPKIIVFVKIDDVRQDLLMICVRNIGNDVALNIRFVFSRTIIDHQNRPMTSGPLIEGISYLAPGESREYVWGAFQELRETMGHTPVIVEYNYQHEKRSIVGRAQLDLVSYAGTLVTQSPEGLMADHLGNIADGVQKIADK